LGYLSISNVIFGINHLLIINHNHIPIIDSNIAPGICGIFLLDMIKNHIQLKHVNKLIQFIPDIFLIISTTFEYIFS